MLVDGANAFVVATTAAAAAKAAIWVVAFIVDVNGV